MLSIVDVHLAFALKRKTSLAINLLVLSCCYIHQKVLLLLLVYLKYKLEPSTSFEELHPGT